MGDVTPFTGETVPVDAETRECIKQQLKNAGEGQWEELIILGVREGGFPTFSASSNLDTRDMVFLLNLLLHTIMYEFEGTEQE